MRYQMYVPTQVVFGCGTVKQLHRQKLPGSRALLVISNGQAMKESGALETVKTELHQADVNVFLFDRVQANPTRATVMDGALAAHENQCDCIVALGGGSVIDAAKAIAALAVNSGDYWDYVSSGTGKGKALTHRPLPVVAIPTTAGTGSETDAACVITHEDTHEKTGFGNPMLFPVLAIVDPELMKTVPPLLTAYQGFDALFHSVECYISKKASDMSDLYAEAAIERISAYLPAAVRDGENMKAREQVAFASTLSGSVMTISGCISEHSLEHAMSAYHPDLPHGAGLLMISEAYFAHFTRCRVCDERFIRMARLMGNHDASAPEDFLKALHHLMQGCGVDRLNMSDYGICPDEFSAMAQNAQITMGRLFQNDPAPLRAADCISIYQRSYQ